MKFKNIFFSLLGGMLIGACTPNEADVYETAENGG